MKKLNQFLLSIVFFSSSLLAQKEAYHWYFGPGLDFSTNPPSPDNNCHKPGGGEGLTSISNENGQLLFYHVPDVTPFDTVFNRQHQMMANGDSIFGDASSTQASLVVKKPGSNNIYYLLSQSGLISTTNYPSGLWYSEINMALAGGNGSVTAKNIPVYANATWGQSEKLTAVKHCNGTDIWVMTHDMQVGNRFRCFLVTAGGVSTTPVLSVCGALQYCQQGTMKFSPTGKKIGLVAFGGFPEVFDFDPSTGIVSNAMALNALTGYGCEFSPDGTKFYAGSSNGTLELLYQWDLCAGSATAINNSKTLVGSGSSTLTNFGTFQNGPDGKMYVACGPTTSVSVINNPNASGLACNFQFLAQSAGTKICQWGLPNFVMSYFKQLPPPFTYTAGNCRNVTFVSPVLTLGCSATTQSYTGLSWNFGDPASGSQNTSGLAGITHTFSAPGTYSVKLILYTNCAADTLKQVVNVASPALNTSPNTTICSGAQITLSVSGGIGYQWSTGGSSGSITVVPNQNSTYIITATVAPACVISKSISVNVQKCTGLETLSAETKACVFPNPCGDELTVKVENAGEIIICDLNGRYLHKAILRPGIQVLDIGVLPRGMYLLRISDDKQVQYFRLSKIE